MAGNYFFRIVKGEDFSRTLTWLQSDGVTRVNLTGYRSAQIIFENDTGVLLTVGLIPDESEAEITLGGTAGTIGIFVPASELSATGFEDCRYRLLLTDSTGANSCLLFGQFALDGTS